MALLKDLTVFGATNLISDTFASQIFASGYHHNEHNDNNYVLLAGGGTKALSELPVNTHNHNGSAAKTAWGRQYVDASGILATIKGAIANAGNITPETTNTYTLGTTSLRWKGLYLGTTDKYGDTNKPIYWNNGMPVAISYTIDATINSGTANKLAYYSGTNAISASSTTIGQITDSNSNKSYTLWYLNAGVPTNADLTIGGTAKPVWVDGGRIKTISATVGSGGKTIVYLNSGEITASTATVGSASKPVYLKNGVLTEGSEIATSGHDHDTRYVKLDAGTTEQTIKNSYASTVDKGSIEIWRAISGGYAMIGFANGTTKTKLGLLGFGSTANEPLFRNTSGTDYKLAHAGNITIPDPVPTIGTTDTLLVTIAGKEVKAKIGSYASSTHNHGTNKTAWGRTYVDASGNLATIKGAISNAGNITPETTNTSTLGTTSLRWKGLYLGTVDKYGDTNKPIYWNNGMPVAISYTIDATVNSGTANKLAYYSGTNAISASSTDIGQTTSSGNTIYKLWYLNAGVPSEATISLGGTAKPVYIDGGQIKTISATVGSGGKTIVYLNSGEITASTATVGSASKPVYLKNGVLTEGSEIATSGHDHDTRYVKLDAGAAEQTIKNSIANLANGSIEIWRAVASKEAMIGFANGTTKTKLGMIGFAESNKPVFRNTSNENKLIAHAGNITVPGTVPTIGTTDTTLVTIAGITVKAKIGSYASSTHTHNGGVAKTAWGRQYVDASGNLATIKGNIENAGNITPETTDISTLGTSLLKWKALYILSGTNGYGSGTRGIYWDNGVPNAMTYELKATVNSGAASKLACYSGANEISASSTNIGQTTDNNNKSYKLWSLADGVPTNADLTIGGTAKPVWIDGGQIKTISSSAGAGNGSTIPAGITLVYFNSGTITESTANVGSASKPVYLKNGVLTEGSETGASGHNHDDKYVKLNATALQTIKSTQDALGNGVLELWRATSGGYSMIGFASGTTKTAWGLLGFSAANNPIFRNTSGTDYKLAHEGNITIPGTVPTIGTSDTLLVTIAGKQVKAKIASYSLSTHKHNTGTHYAWGRAYAVDDTLATIKGNIDDAGTITPETHNTSTVGTSAKRFKTSYNVDEYIGTASGSQCHLNFDNTNKCLKFTFD